MKNILSLLLILVVLIPFVGTLDAQTRLDNDDYASTLDLEVEDDEVESYSDLQIAFNNMDVDRYRISADCPTNDVSVVTQEGTNICSGAQFLREGDYDDDESKIYVDNIDFINQSSRDAEVDIEVEAQERRSRGRYTTVDSDSYRGLTIEADLEEDDDDDDDDNEEKEVDPDNESNELNEQIRERLMRQILSLLTQLINLRQSQS